MLLNDKNVRPYCENIFPQLNFKQIWKNMYLSCIDSQVRDVYLKIIQEVLYVKYFLCIQKISKEKNVSFAIHT